MYESEISESLEKVSVSTIFAESRKISASKNPKLQSLESLGLVTSKDITYPWIYSLVAHAHARTSSFNSIECLSSPTVNKPGHIYLRRNFNSLYRMKYVIIIEKSQSRSRIVSILRLIQVSVSKVWKFSKKLGKKSRQNLNSRFQNFESQSHTWD